MSIKLVGNRARSRDILRAISARRADNNDVTDLRAGFDQMRCPRASGHTQKKAGFGGFRFDLRPG